jgi:hypothetical protein
LLTGSPATAILTLNRRPGRSITVTSRSARSRSGPATRPTRRAGSGLAASIPAEHAKGAAKTFDEARRAFEIAWRYFLAKLTEADFDEYRRSRAFQPWKEAMWDAGLKLPTQVADGRAICFCGAAIGVADFEQHVYAAHMEPKAE